MSGIEQIKQKVKKHGLPLVLALSSEERALIDESLDFLRSAVFSEPSNLNHHKLVAGEQSLEHMTVTLNTLPFLEKWRLLEIHQAEKLSSTEESLLFEYIKNPSPFSILLIIFGKADKRSKLVSHLVSADFFYELKSLEENIIKFIIDYGHAHKIKINQTAAEFLASILDNNLLAIKAALQKLAPLYENQNISEDIIEEHIKNHAQQDVFLLARLVSEGNLSEALFTLGLLRNHQENALKFFGVLCWQFRTLVHIRSCFDEGMNEYDIRKTVGVFKDRFTWMAHIARKRPMEFHTHRLAKLLDCDEAIKSFQNDPFTIIEKFIYQSATGI